MRLFLLGSNICSMCRAGTYVPWREDTLPARHSAFSIIMYHITALPLQHTIVFYGSASVRRGE
jgi:hypothetical protein